MNPISQLNELAQARGWGSPVYQFERLGHNCFSGRVALHGVEVGAGGEGSKSETKRLLAQKMLYVLVELGWGGQKDVHADREVMVEIVETGHRVTAGSQVGWICQPVSVSPACAEPVSVGPACAASPRPAKKRKL